jgi:hypothetical protein
MLELRPDGVYCIPCRRLLRSIGGHLRAKHDIRGKHNRSTLQRMFGLPMGSRFASSATRSSLQTASTENSAVLQVRKNRPNVAEAIHAAGIARKLGQRSSRQQAAAHTLGSGIGLATLRTVWVRNRERAALRNSAIITCEHCHFTGVRRRRGPSSPWPRFCSARCRSVGVDMAKRRAHRAIWTAAKRWTTRTTRTARGPR